MVPEANVPRNLTASCPGANGSFSVHAQAHFVQEARKAADVFLRLEALRLMVVHEPVALVPAHPVALSVLVPYRSILSSWLEVDVRLQIPTSVPSSEFILNAHTALKNC